MEDLITQCFETMEVQYQILLAYYNGFAEVCSQFGGTVEVDMEKETLMCTVPEPQNEVEIVDL